MATSVIIGGSGGLGRVIAQRSADRGDHVVITSRNQTRAGEIAAQIGGHTRGLAIDLSRPETIAADLADVNEERPYPGSTIVTAFNGGVSGLIKTLAVEIAPHRINALHPGVVGDSPKWSAVPNHPHVARTPIGRLVTMDEIADATEFLLRNSGINAHDLFVDGGLLVT